MGICEVLERKLGRTNGEVTIRMLSNLFLSVWLVQIGADRNWIEGNMHTLNQDHSREDTGHCRGFSGPGTCIWKMGKDLFTTIGSRQLPHHDGNNWHFHANLSLGVLPVWDRDLAHIGDMWKPKQSNYTKLTVAKGSGSSYQPLRHWQSHVSSEGADVNTCQLERDNAGVSSKGKAVAESCLSRVRRLPKARDFKAKEDWLAHILM